MARRVDQGRHRRPDEEGGVRTSGVFPDEAMPTWWSLPADEVEREFATTPDGLTAGEVNRRLAVHGPNTLRRQKSRSTWSIAAAQFRSPVILLLALAAAVSFFLDRAVEGAAVVVVIGLSAVIGFAMEFRATRAMEALRRLGQATATVKRAGELVRVPARDLVPGDVLVVEAGDVVTADARIREANALEADESTLTGESMPVAKQEHPIDPDTPVMEQTDMLFKGTVVTRGSGEAVIVGTAMNTEIGKISGLLEEGDADEETPLERRLGLLARRLLWITFAIVLLVGGIGIASGRDPWAMLEIGVALAVATVPEGLPIVATLALARGMWKMARQHALVRRLSAVETLGATGVIILDKTGTLTQNAVRVERVITDAAEYRAETGATPAFVRESRATADHGDELLHRALLVGVLCGNADLGSAEQLTEGVGDPLELALLLAGRAIGLDADALAVELPEVREEPFDPAVRMMATYHRRGDEVLVAVKGGAEAVLHGCTTVAGREGSRSLSESERNQWLERADALASSGLRVIALGEKHVAAADAAPYEQLTLVGLVAMHDPPRREVAGVIEACRAAGIRLVMATGDHGASAGAIAAAAGLAPRGARVLLGRDLPPRALDMPLDETRSILSGSIFARMSPADKLTLLRLHQRSGAVVAMLGDGVNDAPALRRANIGVAMGLRGTEVAKQAADVVLLDDSLATIALAIEQGRVIFDNIRKFAVYLLSCNVSELLVVGLAAMLGMPLPVLPLQILFLNLVTDVFPALALGACEAETGVMTRRPRPASEPLIATRHWWRIAGYGAIVALPVLGSLALALEVLGFSEAEAVTVSFLTLGLAQTVHVFNVRAPRSPFVRNEITRNPWVWGAVALCAVLLVLAVYLPPLARVLGTVAPPRGGWVIVLSMSALAVLVGQAVLATRRASMERSPAAPENPSPAAHR